VGLAAQDRLVHCLFSILLYISNFRDELESNASSDSMPVLFDVDLLMLVYPPLRPRESSVTRGYVSGSPICHAWPLGLTRKLTGRLGEATGGRQRETGDWRHVARLCLHQEE
jgi:hypothetical protein